MGNGELLSVTFDGESFAGALSFDIAGQIVAAQVEGDLNGGQMEGSITLENTPALPFTGSKTSGTAQEE
jgi:hypothetical protein